MGAQRGGRKGARRGGGQTQKKWGPEGWGRRVGARRVGARTQKKWGPEGWSPEGWWPKISRFFFTLPPQNLFFSSLSGGLLVEFWWFEAPGRSNVHVWSSRVVVCEPRRPGLVGPPGFHTTAREPKRAHLSAPVFKNTTKIQREHTQRGKKRTNFAAGQGKKKSVILGGPGEGRSREGGPGKG